MRLTALRQHSSKAIRIILIALLFATIGVSLLIRSMAAPNPNLKGDLNDDNTVTISDLSLLLAKWNKSDVATDLNGDGKINITDLSLLLGNWNKIYTPGTPNPPTPGGGCVAPATDNKLLDQDTSDSQKPWKRNGAAKVVIYFQTKGVPAEWITEMQKGVSAWNKSACLDTRLITTCQANTYCVPVVIGDGGGDDGNFNATESGGFTVKGDIEILSTLKGGERTNVTIHEMGHAVGLVHRKTEHVLMNGDTYDDVFEPDEIDFHNLLVSYGNQQ